jgi:hypothetical protein
MSERAAKRTFDSIMQSVNLKCGSFDKARGADAPRPVAAKEDVRVAITEEERQARTAQYVDALFKSALKQL